MRSLRWLAFGALTLSSGGAFADDAPAREGTYSGISAGVGQPKAHKPKRQVPAGTLAWVGFSPKNGGAEVFFAAPGSFAVEQVVDGGVLHVRLTGLRKLGPNAKRAIDTRYFDNPLARIAAHGARGKNGVVTLRLVFKNAKDAKPGATRAEDIDGLHYEYLVFPEGAESAPPADLPTRTAEPGRPVAKDAAAQAAEDDNERP